MQYNIMDYGAIPDGVTNNQPMIQQAIDACAKTGGTVVIPAGNFLSGTIRLRSNMELHLERGSVLTVSRNPEHIRTETEENDSSSDTMDNIDSGSFLYACHEKNITISGDGMIDGQGRNVYVDDNADEGMHECPLNVEGFRPRTSYLEDIDGLTVTGITFYDASFWTLHMAGCRNVRIDGIQIRNNDRGPNNDGIDPDACQNVIISNCMIESGDDAIVLKATKPIWEKYGNCENIVIRGCILHSRDSALKIGTETYGDIRNVILSDCIVKDCSRAVGIWARDGGTIEDIYVHHILANTKRYADCPKRSFAPRWWGKGEPVFVSAAFRNQEKRYPGTIRRVAFEHVQLFCESSIFIAGEQEARIEDVVFRDCCFTWKKQGNFLPDVFDEQPSVHDVYPHEIPWLYVRSADGISVSGQYVIDESLAGYVGETAEIEDSSRIELP